MAKRWARAFYKSRAWRDCRRFVLKRDHYTCAHCSGRAEEVHHVIELTPENINNPSIALNPDNLISLCHNCHTKETSGFGGDLPGGYVFDESGQVIEIR